MWNTKSYIDLNPYLHAPLNLIYNSTIVPCVVKLIHHDSIDVYTLQDVHYLLDVCIKQSVRCSVLCNYGVCFSVGLLSQPYKGLRVLCRDM